MTANRRAPQPPRIRPAGPNAILVELPDLPTVRAYHGEVQRRRRAGQLPRVVDVIPAARTILFDGVDDPVALAREILTWQPSDPADTSEREVAIPTVYDGPDLAAVARLWGMTCPEAVRFHTELLHEVAFLGFAPGFAYLIGLPEARKVPRLPRPRTQVPQGSVALAGTFTGIYPRTSPGGWQIIGRTRTQLWRPETDQPALLTPGTRVRFAEIPA